MPARGPGSRGGGGGKGAQSPGQDPSDVASQMQQLYSALGSKGMLPQSPDQQAPAQMDPSSTVDAMTSASKMQDLGTYLGTYRPSVWAQQRGVTGPAPTNVLSSQTTDALAPLMKAQMGNQNQNQLINFGNTQAAAQTAAKNQGLDQVSGMYGAQQQGDLQMKLAQLYANAMKNNKLATQTFSLPEQQGLGTMDELTQRLNENKQIRDKYRDKGVGSLIGYGATPSGMLNRIKSMTGMGTQDEFATDAQTFNDNVQYASKEYARLVTPGRTPTPDIIARIAKAKIPGADPVETDDRFDAKHSNLVGELSSRNTTILANKPAAAARRNAALNPKAVNQGTGVTQDSDSMPVSEPGYAGNPPANRVAPKAGDKSQGVPRTQRRPGVQRMLQKYGGR